MSFPHFISVKKIKTKRALRNKPKVVEARCNSNNIMPNIQANATLSVLSIHGNLARPAKFWYRTKLQLPHEKSL